MIKRDKIDNKKPRLLKKLGLDKWQQTCQIININASCGSRFDFNEDEFTCLVNKILDTKNKNREVSFVGINDQSVITIAVMQKGIEPIDWEDYLTIIYDFANSKNLTIDYMVENPFDPFI